jgi:hypothetical protein
LVIFYKIGDQFGLRLRMVPFPLYIYIYVILICSNGPHSSRRDYIVLILIMYNQLKLTTCIKNKVKFLLVLKSCTYILENLNFFRKG